MEEEDETSAKITRMISVIGPCVGITVCSGSMMFSARAKAASLIFKNPMALASFLGRLASVSALAEFLLNPIFGKLSDTYGRKPIMPLGHW
jgi:MFS family permease